MSWKTVTEGWWQVDWGAGLGVRQVTHVWILHRGDSTGGTLGLWHRAGVAPFAQVSVDGAECAGTAALSYAATGCPTTGWGAA